MIDIKCVTSIGILSPHKKPLICGLADELPIWSEKTFEGVVPAAGETETDAKRMFAYSAYKALLTGVHKSYNAMFGMGPSDFIPAAFEGTRNYARRLSQSRVIIYNR
jgi:hypothetical protein